MKHKANQADQFWFRGHE